MKPRPAGKMRYANASYNLLAATVEAASGMPYASYLKQELFVPAGMLHSGEFGADPLVASAHSYVAFTDWGGPDTWPRNWRMFGEGDIYTTVGDLWCWRQAIRGGTVLNADSIHAQRTPLAPIENQDSYGLGMMRLKTNGGRFDWEHGGDTELGDNSLYREMDDGWFIAIVSNASAGDRKWMRWAVQDEIEKATEGAAPRKAPRAFMLSQGQLAALAGAYNLRGGRIELIDDGALLWLVPDGQAAVDLFLAPAPAAPSATERTTALLAGVTSGNTAIWEGMAGKVNAGDMANGWATTLAVAMERRCPIESPVRGSIRAERRSSSPTCSSFRAGCGCVSFGVMEVPGRLSVSMRMARHFRRPFRSPRSAES